MAESPTRLSAYHLALLHEILAKDHFDKGLLAIQHATSHLGLQVARSRDSELVLVRYGTSQGVMTPALGIQTNIDPDTPFKAAWHNASNTGITVPDRYIPKAALSLFGRWSIQSFADMLAFDSPDKTQTHSRL